MPTSNDRFGRAGAPNRLEANAIMSVDGSMPTTDPRGTRSAISAVIFPSPQLPPQHLGWNGRLNGPADLNTTSCLSCHIAAQYPAVTSLVPVGAVPDGGPTPPAQGGSPQWMLWFRNLPAGTSFDERTYSTDFSFQVAISLQNFFDVKTQQQQKELEAKLKVITHLEARSGGPVKVMSDLSGAMPDKLWLTEFNEAAGMVKMSGFSVDEQTIADFLRRLGSSSYFTGVDLDETTQVTQENVKQKKFTLKAPVNS